MKDWYIFSQYCEMRDLNPGIIPFWRSFSRSFKESSLWEKFGMVLLLISTFLTIVLMGLYLAIPQLAIYFFISLLLMCVVSFVLVRYTKYDPLKLLKKRSDQQKEVLKFLKENGLTDKNQIKQLHNRLLNRLMEWDHKNDNTMNKSPVVLTVLIIPLFLLIVSKIIDSSVSLNDMIFYGIFAFVCCLLIYATVYIVLKLICTIDARRYNNLRGFIRVLRDILDFEFPIENEDILEVHYYKS